jgi:hypothetical protein
MKVYYINSATNIVEAINILKIMIFLSPNLFIYHQLNKFKVLIRNEIQDYDESRVCEARSF